MSFAATFAELVVPTLKDECRRRGYYVAEGIDDFGEAHAAVMAIALRRGLSHLAPDAQEKLDEWMASTILKYTDEFTPACRAASEAADRAEADFLQWGSAWTKMMD